MSIAFDEINYLTCDRKMTIRGENPSGKVCP